MKTLHNNYCNSKQGYLPLFLSDYLDLLDPVLTFDRLMGGIDLNKYLTDIPEYTTGRLRYNPVNIALNPLARKEIKNGQNTIYMSRQRLKYGEKDLIL